ncbi:hypothetical protein CFP56_021009 [Quercus suber]|uniref:Uncharacterized protein n=1 Tax=Quercus suber TaxID=58331 RepID=A0AAW0M2G5_QUESU
MFGMTYKKFSNICANL